MARSAALRFSRFWCLIVVLTSIAVAAERKESGRNESAVVINIKGTGGQSQYIKEDDTVPKAVTVTIGQTVRWVNMSDALGG
jgi:hypothetical protein